MFVKECQAQNYETHTITTKTIYIYNKHAYWCGKSTVHAIMFVIKFFFVLGGESLSKINKTTWKMRETIQEWLCS